MQRDAQRSPHGTNVAAGFRNLGSNRHILLFEGELNATVAYRVERDGNWCTSISYADAGGAHVVDMTALHVIVDADGVRCQIGDEHRSYSIHTVDDHHYIDSALGHTQLREVPRFPEAKVHASVGSLRSPLPGSVVQLLTAVGARVAAGDVLLSLEAMTMEHTIQAPYDGVVSAIHVEIGQQVETGEVLVVVDGEVG